MKNIRSLFLALIFIPTIGYSDMGSCSILKVEIETINKTKVQGYFTIASYDFYIERRDKSAFYSTKTGWKELCVGEPIENNELEILDYNYKFFNHVIERTKDSLSISTDLIRFSYDDQFNNGLLISKLVGNETKICKSDIATLKVIKIFTCGVGEFIVTDLEEKDKSWATSANFNHCEFMGGSEMCSYKVISFEKSTNESDSNLNELKKLVESRNKIETEAQIKSQEYPANEITKINLKIKDAIQELKKNKIIVANFCSC